MIKKLIPHYYIDDDSSEDRTIKDNIHFSISPYFDELPDNSQKIFNSLLSNEKVYTEKMMDEVIQLLNNIHLIIERRQQNIKSDLEKMPVQHPSIPFHPLYVLNENYGQQLRCIDELKKIFQK